MRVGGGRENLTTDQLIGNVSREWSRLYEALLSTDGQDLEGVDVTCRKLLDEVRYIVTRIEESTNPKGIMFIETLTDFLKADSNITNQHYANFIKEVDSEKQKLIRLARSQRAK